MCVCVCVLTVSCAMCVVSMHRAYSAIARMCNSSAVRCVFNLSALAPSVIVSFNEQLIFAAAKENFHSIQLNSITM